LFYNQGLQWIRLCCSSLYRCHILYLLRFATTSNIPNNLQTQFCPPLDTSLLAALVTDIDVTQNTVTQVKRLRRQLQQLATQAEQDHSHITNMRQQHMVDDPLDSSVGTTSSSSFSSGSSSSSMQSSSSSSALEFLQAALPHISTQRLEKALSDEQEGGEDDVDMERVVEGLLTGEYLRELEERGLDCEESVEKKDNSKPTGKRNRQRGQKNTFDIRHLARTMDARRAPTTDPWTALSSMSTHLSSLVRPHPASYFQSYFHSPDHSSPYHAVIAALSQICESNANPNLDVTLPGLLEIIQTNPIYPTLLPSDHNRIFSDARLALCATQGRSSEALDLVWLLHDLHTRFLDLGVYHQCPPKLHAPPSPFLPPPPPPPPPSQPLPSSTSLPSSKPHSPKPPPYTWQSVPARRQRPTDPTPHPLAASIPAYAQFRNVRGNVGEQQQHDVIVARYRRRDELLREASRAWKNGSWRTRGGEVALNFAERVSFSGFCL
jgi:hypothetical protein